MYPYIVKTIDMSIGEGFTQIIQLCEVHVAKRNIYFDK